MNELGQGDTEARSALDYAPTGKLRAALNFGNAVLVGRDGAGRAAGITVDLARELARSLEVDLELVEFRRAVDVANASDEWDICFLAVDPARSGTVAFTAPYVRISGSFLAGRRTAAQSADDVVHNSLRVAVVEGSAYTLFLSRRPGADNLVTLSTFDDALAALDEGRVDAIAGIQQAMQSEAALRPGSRVLEPPFMQIRQAIGLPAPRRHLVADLEQRLSTIRSSGQLPQILERHGVPRDCAL